MSDTSTASVQSLTSTFRKFNRFYTGLIGTLSRGYLKTPFSLQEARVIFEVARNPGCTAKEIQSRAGFDQAYLSRLVARLMRAKLINKTKSVEDRRAQRLLLTAAGKKAFNILNKRANQQARQIFAHLNPEQASQAMRLVSSDATLTLMALPNPPLFVSRESETWVGFSTGRQ